jgi:hypothetical protein
MHPPAPGRTIRALCKRYYLEILLLAALVWVGWSAFQAWQHPR